MGEGLGAAVAVFVGAMAILHHHDPRSALYSRDAKYTFPSEAKLAGGKLISAKTLMMDQYCLDCHKDAYDGWFHSAHHFSSFNNKFYLASVRETRKVSIERDGTTRAARWCAGCHDPVPFFSGEFDDPKYDDVNNPTSQAGITCTACHAITHVESTRGNADYTIEEPQHYPFATSDNKFLKWVNRTLVKAKPEMHKKTFLKPEVHRDSTFCSTCHKVGIPYALNHWQDFTRGQNHWDTFLLSGVSGGGARSFYYPPPDTTAKNKCTDCHMNLMASDDFGARRDFDGSGQSKIHNHLFLGSNTGLPFVNGDMETAKAQADFLKDKKVRIDVFALREGGEIDGALLGPIRPEIPTLKPGGKYLVETVVRTLGLGHPFSQGTVDSNEIWVELTVRGEGKVIGRSGGIGPDGTVDPYSHFINVYMLDRDGKRIDRRNPQDIFVPLYNKQIPPGAGQVVHFALDVPEGMNGPIELEAKVNYRKFDRKYLDYVFGPGKGPELPVVVMAADSVKLPVEGGPKVENPPSPIKEVWQRWNDYGIGLFLEGSDKGGQKGELKQAEPVFRKVAELGRADGWVNLARIYQREGRIPDAQKALEAASKHKEPAAPWVIAWLSAQIDEKNGYLDEAIAKYRSVLDTKIPARKFDFSKDYEIINEMGAAARPGPPVPEGERGEEGRAGGDRRHVPPDPGRRFGEREGPLQPRPRPGRARIRRPARRRPPGEGERGRRPRSRGQDAGRPQGDARRARRFRGSGRGRGGEDHGREAAGVRLPAVSPARRPRTARADVAGGDGRRLQGEVGPVPGDRPQGAALDVQAGRDGRGPRREARPPGQSGGRQERAVDRDPPSPPPGCPGVRRLDPEDPSPGGLRMNRTSTRLALAGAALAGGLAGCNPPAPTATVAPPVAPRAVTTAKPLKFPAVKFVEITKDAGIDFVHANGMTGEKLLPETMGSGVAFLDFDNDGDPDLFFVNSCPWPGKESTERPTQRLFRNDGKGHFEDVTKAAGLDVSFFGQGAAVGDYDNDGDPDLYVTGVGGGHLFRNDGGKFVDVTESAGAGARTAGRPAPPSSTWRTTATSTCSSPST